MLKLTKMILCSAAITIASSANGAILHPEMTVAADAGTYAKPAGTLGEKPAEAWTATTIAAGVDKKPRPGKVLPRSERLSICRAISSSASMARSTNHAARKCLQNSQPIGLLTKGGEVYMLMEEEHDPRRDGQTTFRQAAIDNFAKIIEVTGTEASVGGYKAIFVQGYVKK